VSLVALIDTVAPSLRRVALQRMSSLATSFRHMSLQPVPRWKVSSQAYRHAVRCYPPSRYDDPVTVFKAADFPATRPDLGAITTRV
jgi:hypothetical protein